MRALSFDGEEAKRMQTFSGFVLNEFMFQTISILFFLRIYLFPFEVLVLQLHFELIFETEIVLEVVERDQLDCYAVYQPSIQQNIEMVNFPVGF